MEQRNPPERRSPRLRGFDYAECGAYFVTVCTANRACILGRVEDGRMELSPIGRIVDECWREIPRHFKRVRADVYRIMPNHVHGIIEIGGRQSRSGESRRDVACNVPTTNPGSWFARISPKRSSLSVIVRSFKSASTKRCHDQDVLAYRGLWQPRFHDRIIRDDREHFFIEQYISLNPVMWHLDRNNPGARMSTVDQLRQELRERHSLDEYAIEHIVDGWMNG